VFFMCT